MGTIDGIEGKVLNKYLKAKSPDTADKPHIDRLLNTGLLGTVYSIENGKLLIKVKTVPQYHCF